MKKTLLILCAAVLALASCQKAPLAPEEGTGTPTGIVFKLSATHPDDTKAVKAAWEENDVIFVFFSGQASPKYLELKWDGTTWKNTPKNELALADSETGTMRAVYLPFGSNATVSADGGSFKFNNIYYSYYLTATLDYTVTDGAVSGTFDMQIPEDYVQFFVEDNAAVNGADSLGTDAVIPVGVASIAANGAINETGDKSAGDYMPGYAYSGGYLFSGKLNPGYHSYQRVDASTVEANAYYLAKKKASDNSRTDYFVTGKTLASHTAVKLPANDDIYSPSTPTGKWVPVGSDKTIKLKSGNTDLGTWYSCNYGTDVPEALGTPEYFNTANGHGVKLPTKNQFDLIIRGEFCTWTWLTVHGQKGDVVQADQGFIFLPADGSTTGTYWSGESIDFPSVVYPNLYFYEDGTRLVSQTATPMYNKCVRPIE